MTPFRLSVQDRIWTSRVEAAIELALLSKPLDWTRAEGKLTVVCGPDLVLSVEFDEGPIDLFTAEVELDRTGIHPKLSFWAALIAAMAQQDPAWIPGTAWLAAIALYKLPAAPFTANPNELLLPEAYRSTFQERPLLDFLKGKAVLHARSSAELAFALVHGTESLWRHNVLQDPCFDSLTGPLPGLEGLSALAGLNLLLLTTKERKQKTAGCGLEEDSPLIWAWMEAVEIARSKRDITKRVSFDTLLPPIPDEWRHGIEDKIGALQFSLPPYPSSTTSARISIPKILTVLRAQKLTHLDLEVNGGGVWVQPICEDASCAPFHWILGTGLRGLVLTEEWRRIFPGLLSAICQDTNWCQATERWNDLVDYDPHGQTVVPHTARKLRPGEHASRRAWALARSIGERILPGTTFVRTHQRKYRAGMKFMEIPEECTGLKSLLPVLH